eukprot:GHUV01019962.1.p1 GENE.GHUV01019962.1~~GHUV01019962.1.p1  ORF type:complete len:118 (-),score=7.64 GHUV01019962.1:596-949(-)
MCGLRLDHMCDVGLQERFTHVLATLLAKLPGCCSLQSKDRRQQIPQQIAKDNADSTIKAGRQVHFGALNTFVSGIMHTIQQPAQSQVSKVSLNPTTAIIIPPTRQECAGKCMHVVHT